MSGIMLHRHVSLETSVTISIQQRLTSQKTRVFTWVSNTGPSLTSTQIQFIHYAHFNMTHHTTMFGKPPSIMSAPSLCSRHRDQLYLTRTKYTSSSGVRMAATLALSIPGIHHRYSRITSTKSPSFCASTFRTSLKPYGPPKCHVITDTT